MPRCPKCGAWVVEYRSVNDMTFCQKCGAVLKLLPGSRFGRYEQVNPLDEPQKVTPTKADTAGRSGSAEDVSTRPPFRGDESRWGHCNYCGAVIVLSNSKFCSNCGASLTEGSEDATPLGGEGKARPNKRLETAVDHGEKCMVCDLELTQDDNAVWCPRCGKPAHRVHLLEWIHVKNRCPVCGEFLREQDFQ